MSWPDRHLAQPYDSDLLLDVIESSVVLLIRGRNAWNSTWVRHYLEHATLYTDVAGAKTGAEERRGPGNVFYIQEAPALILEGMKSRVILCDTHPDIPFQRFSGVGPKITKTRSGAYVSGVYPGVSVRDAVRVFAHNSDAWAGPPRSVHSLRTGLIKSGWSGPQRKNFVSLKSVASGSRYQLQWSPESSRYRNRGAKTVATSWANQLRAVEHAVGSTGVAALSEYRSSVLSCQPESTWEHQRQTVLAGLNSRVTTARALVDQIEENLEETLDALFDAEEERSRAAAARLQPASTSAKLRAQRERLERANAACEELKRALTGEEEKRRAAHERLQSAITALNAALQA